MEGTNLCICGFLSTEIVDEKDRDDPYSTVWQLQIECGKKEKNWLSQLPGNVFSI